MMEKKHPQFKYVFLFKKFKKEEPLHLSGKSITDFWNDIYDLLDVVGKMKVQKLNGHNFMKKEIKRLFWEVYEDMQDDLSAIDLKVQNLKTLLFINLYDFHLDDLFNEEKNEEDLEKEDPRFEERTKKLSQRNLNDSLARFDYLFLKSLSKGFDIRESSILKLKNYPEIQKYLEYFQKAKESPDQWALNLRHIIDDTEKRGDLKETYEIFCNSSIKNSTHEGKGVHLKKKLREYTKEEKKDCERKIKQYLQSLINKTGLNPK